MMWIGLLVGVVLGAAVDGGGGALVGGFIGWLIGLIVGSMRAKPEAPAASAALPAGTEGRIARLEVAMARMEARLDRLETGEAELPAMAAATPEPPPPPPTPEAAYEPPIPPQPATPSEPNPIVAWLTGGNAIARIGSLILFFGLAFLLKYAADHSLLPVELRVAGVAAVGVALLVFGWRLRDRKRGYALGLQGAGVAIFARGRQGCHPNRLIPAAARSLPPEASPPCPARVRTPSTTPPA